MRQFKTSLVIRSANRPLLQRQIFFDAAKKAGGEPLIG